MLNEQPKSANRWFFMPWKHFPPERPLKELSERSAVTRPQFLEELENKLKQQRFQPSLCALRPPAGIGTSNSSADYNHFHCFGQLWEVLVSWRCWSLIDVVVHCQSDFSRVTSLLFYRTTELFSVACILVASFTVPPHNMIRLRRPAYGHVQRWWNKVIIGCWHLKVSDLNILRHDMLIGDMGGRHFRTSY